MADQFQELERLHRHLAGSLGVVPWISEDPETRMVRTLSQDPLIFGHPRDLWEQDNGLWFSHVHRQDRKHVKSVLELTPGTDAPTQYEYRFLGRDGSILWLRDIVEHRSDSKRFSGLMMNITNHKLADLQLGIFDPLIRAVNESRDVPLMFERVLEHICKSTGWVIGQIWLPETEATFSCVASWHIGDRALERFAAASRATIPNRSTGFIGTAFTMRSPLWTVNVGRDLHYDRGRVALEAGLESGVAIPVLSADQVVGVLEFFMTEKRSEESLLAEVISAASAQLGAALHRRVVDSMRGNTSALLRAILQNSPNMIFVKDLEGRYLEVNDKFLEQFHLTRAQVIGMTDLEIFPASQAESFRANDRLVLSRQAAIEFEETAMHSDGPHVSIVHKFPLKDETGMCYALGGIVTDITARNAARGSKRSKPPGGSEQR